MKKPELERRPAKSPAANKSIARKPAPAPSPALRSPLGNQDAQRLLERRSPEKLRVSRPHDAEEIEADRIAGNAVSARPGKSREPSSAPEAMPIATPGSGKPLEPALRQEMEASFGTSFAAVTIHDGPDAAESAEAVNARAFTVGNRIAFARGEYAPQSSAGKKLLAHELAHTVQQANAPSLTLQRSPNTKQIFDTSGAHAKEIDKLIADSPLKKYMSADWKTLSGNYDYVDPSTFQHSYEAYSKRKTQTKRTSMKFPASSIVRLPCKSSCGVPVQVRRPASLNQLRRLRSRRRYMKRSTLIRRNLFNSTLPTLLTKGSRNILRKWRWVLPDPPIETNSRSPKA